MNLHKLIKCFILLWLSLARSEVINTKKFNDSTIENVENALAHNVKEKKEDPVEVVQKEKKERTESLFVDRSTRIAFSRNRASENSPKKYSANRDDSYSRGGVKISSMNQTEPNKGEQNDKSAQKLTYSIKKDLSALNVINFVTSWRNRSAVVPLPNNRTGKDVEETTPKRRRRKRDAVVRIPKIESAKLKDNDEVVVDDGDDDDEPIPLDDRDDLDEDEEDANNTDVGTYIGAPCLSTCSSKLIHVFCDPGTQLCECEKKYPVQIGIGKGCAKPKQLGDQCFYAQTCSFYDANAVCTQINHNAICQCKPGFHTVALQKGVKRMFCSEDLVVLTADLPTLLGVATGIAILTGLICFVLKLFSSNRYPHPRHYANANLAPPLLFSSDNQWINGIPLTVHGRPSSRTSSQRSTTNLAHYTRSKGVLVPASRAGAARAAAILLIPCHLQASRTPEPDVTNNSNNDDTDVVQENDIEQSSHPGSRRPSISSIHSTASSQKSMTYSARRFEQENQQREQRAAMRAAREEAARMAAPPTPSPMSTDELLPSCSKLIESDPLGFTSSVLSVKSGASPRENSIPEFPEFQANLSPSDTPVMRH